jgi:transposase
MTRDVVLKTKPMQVIEARIGRPLDEYLRSRYIADGWTAEEIAKELELHRSTVLKWLVHFGIEVRFPGQRGKAAVA